MPFLFVPHLLVPTPSKTQLPPRLHHMSAHHQNPQAASGTNLNTKNTTTVLGQLWATSCWSVLGSLITCLPCSFISFLGINCWPLPLLQSLFSRLSWVYSLLILWPFVSWPARVWILNEHETVLLPVTVESIFFAWTSQIKSLRSRNSSMVAAAPDSSWLTKPSLWRTGSRQLQSGFQRVGFRLATVLSTAGHGYSKSTAAATHTGQCESMDLSSTESDSVLLLSSRVRKLSCSTAAVSKWFVFNCIHLQQLAFPWHQSNSTTSR